MIGSAVKARQSRYEIDYQESVDSEKGITVARQCSSLPQENCVLQEAVSVFNYGQTPHMCPGLGDKCFHQASYLMKSE